MDLEVIMRMPEDARLRFCLASAKLCELLTKMQISRGADRQENLALIQKLIRDFVKSIGHDFDLELPKNERKNYRGQTIDELDAVILEGQMMILTVALQSERGN